MTSLERLSQNISNCKRCPRLRKHCLTTAAEKRRALKDDDYWGLPVAGFGDPKARLVLVGLAPAAHGANRTGRMFTGDRSGEWLYRALFKAGFANQARSESRKDGLELHNAFVTAAARCAPPQNKLLPEELAHCAPYLKQELSLLKNAEIYLALGQVALTALWRIIGEEKPRPQFSHGGHVQIQAGKHLLLSYHPSQQNTFTGRLTEPMFDSVFEKANQLLRLSRS